MTLHPTTLEEPDDWDLDIFEHGDSELNGEPQRVRSNFVGGLRHLPVELTLA